MAKVIKIAGLVVGAAVLAVATAGAGLALAGGLSLSTAIGIGGAVVGATFGVSAGTLLLGAAALSAVGSALSNPHVAASQTERLTASIDPRAFRKTVLGQTAMATDIRYEEWSGKDQEYCDWIVALASHAADGVEEIWLEQEMAWSATTGVVSKYAGYFSVPNIVLEGSPANAITFASGKWNQSARLTGCAYLRMQFKVTGNGKKAESPFASSIPSRVTIIGRGAKLYDPRRDSTVSGGSGPMRWNDQSTWRYTADDGAVIGENLALQILRVVLGWRIHNPATGEMRLAVGSGVPGRRLDMVAFQVAANLCDEPVNRSSGGTEPRYHGAGVISEGDDPKQILDMLCAACSGRFRDTGGKLSLVISHNDLAAAAADDGLSDDDVVGAFTWDPDPALEATPNVARGRYVDATSASLYQLIDYPEVRIASLDGQDRIMTLDVGVIESPSQAQRVVRQALQRRQYQRSFSSTFDIRAWKYTVGDVVPFTFAPLSFTRVLFRVASQELGQGGTCDMTLSIEHQQIYAWDASDAPAVLGADPIVYDKGNNPLILGINEAATMATAVVLPGAAIGGTIAPDGTIIGGRPAGVMIDDLDRVTSDLDITRGDVDIVKADVNILTPSVFDLAKLLQTNNAYLMARTTLEGKPIGTVVVDVQTVADSAVEELHLLGAKNGDNTAFLIDMNTVWTSAGVSLSQRFTQTEAKASDAVQALSTSVSKSMADAAQSVATQIDTVQTKFGQDIGAATQSTMKAVTDADSALSARIDEGVANYGQFHSDYQTYQQAVADKFQSTAQRIDTVEANFGDKITAATQSTMKAVTDADQALSTRIDAGKSNFDQFSTSFEDYRQGVATKLGATSQAIDTVKAEIDGDNGISAQVGFLRSAVVTPGGNAQAKAVLSLKANNRVGGLIATNDGEILTLDLDFDVTRIFKPDGTLLLLAGPAGEVYMPSVRVDTLVAGAINFEFTGDRQLLDPAGWVQELPGGFIMMGGQYRASLNSEASISIVYPKPFPLQTLAYGANGYNSNGNNRKDLYPQNTGAPSASGASFYMQAPNDNAIALDGFDWWAWGR